MLQLTLRNWPHRVITYLNTLRIQGSRPLPTVYETVDVPDGDTGSDPCVPVVAVKSTDHLS